MQISICGHNKLDAEPGWVLLRAVFHQATGGGEAPSNNMSTNSRKTARCFDMDRLLTFVVLGGLGLSQVAVAAGQAAGQMAVGQMSVSGSAPSVKSANSTETLPDVPALPRGKSTIFGGAIKSVDPVRDQLTLNVYGEKPMKILFDERTQLFEDGKKIPLHDLAPSAHVSVQTTLDGAKIFALSIHVLSQSPQGDYQGRVVSFNPETGVLVLSVSDSREPFRVVISPSTSFKRLGQSSFASGQSGTTDLVRGSLVSVTFESEKGQGVAREVSVLAAPGASFIFSGNVSALDMHAGLMVVVDPRDDKSYQIHFDTSDPGTQQLRNGQHVRVSAAYDGARYVAT